MKRNWNPEEDLTDEQRKYLDELSRTAVEALTEAADREDARRDRQ
jgi:hypothetical protein